MRRARLFCVLLVVCSFWARDLVVAQERAGSISGTVTDAGRYVLPGARVAVEPKGPAAISDAQGRFTIPNVPPGDYTLMVSYVGLLPYTEKLTVASGQNTRVDAVLQVAGVNRPRFPVLNGVNISDPSTYALANWQAPADDPTSQRNIQGALNVARPYATGSRTGLFEVGAKLRDAHKTRVVTDQYSSATGAPALTMAAIPGGPTDPNYYFGSYQLGPLTDYNKLVSFLASNPSAIALNVDSTHQRDDPNNSTVSERIYAGYAMNSSTSDRAICC